MPNGRHTVGITPYSLLIDDEVWATKAPQGDFQLSNNLYLFAANDVAHQNVYTRDGQTSIICHGCTISENGTLKRNFVPCVRNADAVAGLYDTVSGVFYLPRGGTLTLGCDEPVVQRWDPEADPAVPASERGIVGRLAGASFRALSIWAQKEIQRGQAPLEVMVFAEKMRFWLVIAV